MKSFIIFLVIISLAIEVSGKRTNLPQSKLFTTKLLKTMRGWHTASGSYYNPLDSYQTRKNTNGIGAFGRMIKSGSIALGSFFTKIFKKKKMQVFVQVKGKNLNIQTPYGKNIFRVDDAMNARYNGKKQFHIDFYQKDLDHAHKKLGRFPISFKIYKIKLADLHSLQSANFF
jgi:hypothetical protein